MKRILGMIVLTSAVALTFSAAAGQGGGSGTGGPEHKRPPLEVVIKIALDHQTDLGLSADQVTRLQALAKNPPPKPEHKPTSGGSGGPPPSGGGGSGGNAGGPPGGGKGPGGPLKDILTADQMTKLHELVKEAHPGGPPGGGQGSGQKTQ